MSLDISNLCVQIEIFIKLTYLHFLSVYLIFRYAAIRSRQQMFQNTILILEIRIFEGVEILNDTIARAKRPDNGAMPPPPCSRAVEKVKTLNGTRSGHPRT